MKALHHEGGDRWLLAGLCVLLGVLLMAPMDALSQLAVAVVMVLLLRVLGQAARINGSLLTVSRIAALLLGASLSLRYLLWRSFYTLDIDEIASLIGALLLYAAELYAVGTHIMGCIISAAPLRRPQRDIRDLDPQVLPSVDVLVPTYDEASSLLEVTLLAATQLRYPSNRLRIYLLDDGGTEQRLQSSRPEVAAAAAARRRELQALCARLGVTYLTRERNEAAKAGNLNSALAHTDGDMVAVLDADHVPSRDFLARTIPWLMDNERVFLVQTPHHMNNPDPVERNYLRAFRRMPSESDMFYGAVQRGLDFWDASFFCGSAAVLRRTHLDAVGGISGDSITEDAETSLRLHARELDSVYLDEPLVSGLAPDSFEGFVRQRLRWSQGMTQILMLKKPYRLPGLRWHQRLGYLGAITFWLFPFARILFLLMPLAFLIFDLQIYNASLQQILAFTLPHVIGTFLIADVLHGRTRWPLVSELYELLQCLFTVRAVVDVFRNPRAPSFAVTPKGEQLADTTISPLVTVFYWLLFALVCGMVAGVLKWLDEPLTRELTFVVLTWNLFNLVLVLGALATLVETRQLRQAPRVPASDRVLVEESDGTLTAANLVDISVTGCALELDAAAAHERSNEALDVVALHGWATAGGKHYRLPTRMLSAVGERGQLRLEFTAQTDEDRRDVVDFALGNSERIATFRRRRQRPMGYWHSLVMILGSSAAPLYRHLQLIFTRLRQHFPTRRTIHA